MKTVHYALPLALLMFVAVWSAAAQEVKVLASVNETSVGTEERVTYSIEIQGGTLTNVQTPNPPETQGLTLLQRFPSTQRNVSIVNGQMTQSLAFRWAYAPVREGSATILPAEVTIGDQTFRTAAINLTIVPQAQRPQPQARSNPLDPFAVRPSLPSQDDAPPEVDSRDIFIRAIPSARRVFQNEQVLIEYHLFFREGIQIRQSRLTDSWDAEGFWREELDIEARPIPQVVVENGLRYNTILLKRVSVFPTRSGDLRVDPLRIESEVYVPYRGGFRDPFDQFFNRRNRYQTVALASPSVSITARPLPPKPPPGFRGAVGTFQMDTRIDRTEVEVGASVQITTIITGTGNIATLEAPAIVAPGIFEAYDPQVNASINRKGQRIRGTKTFTYILVPRSNGAFEITPPAFTFLNTRTGAYESIAPAPITVVVTGTAAAVPLATTTAGGLPVDDIAGLLPAEGRGVRLGRPPLHLAPWAYGALATPLLLLLLLGVYHRHAMRLATDSSFARGRRAHPMARKYLKQAEARLKSGEARSFYEALERAVLGYIGNRLDIAERGLTRQQLDQHVALLGLGPGVRQQLKALLDECDRIRFAPLAPDRAAMEASLERAGALIIQIDQALTRPGTSKPSLAVLLLLLLPTALQAQPVDVVRHLDLGNQQYTRGYYQGALEAYQQALDAGYASGALYYNMGNAYYRLDDLGEAIRHYEKARRLMPDDRQLLHNLAIARGRTVDQFSQLPTPFWVPWWRRAVAAMGARGFFFVGLALYLAAAALAGYRRWTRTTNAWLRRAFAIATLSGLLFLAAAFAASLDATLNQEAILLAEEASLREAPEATAGSELTLHEGLHLGILQRQDAWIEVRLPNGVTGWIEANTVGLI